MNIPAPAPRTDPETIAAFLRNLRDDGEVFEIRAPNYSDHPEGKYASTVSGFFTDVDTAVSEVVKFASRGSADNWYTIVNAVKPELFALSANRLKPKAKGTTADKDVGDLTRILIDVDPIRKAGISSTAAELAVAENTTDNIRAFLDGQGWPEPVRTMSGNGAALIYNTHLPHEDGELLSRFLNALAFRFDSNVKKPGPWAKVDTSCFNPARPTKLIGTVAGKGDSIVGVPGMEDRPHRMSRLVSVPETPGIVTREMILAVVESIEAEYPPEPTRTTPTPQAKPAVNGKRFDTFVPTLNGVEAYLRGRGVEVKGTRDDMILLARCPVVPDCQSTGDTDIAVIVGKDGTIAYKNMHDRGTGLMWVHLRDALEPGYREWSEGYKNGTAPTSSKSAGTFTPGDAPGNLGGTFDAGGGEPRENFTEGTIPPAPPSREFEPIPPALTFKQLRANHPRLREAVVEGLLRVGETANFIASTKVGKTWLTYAMALCISTGRPFLNRFACEKRRVLLLDNELHPEVIADRVPKVAEAMGILSSEYDETLHVRSLRGKLADLYRLKSFLEQYPPRHFGLVIIDAWYRALPRDTDENANGEIAHLYNLLDSVADRMGCAFVVVHHASKGVQGGKAVTDVGSGAGSMSRAVDSHIVIRPHEQDGAFVMDAAVRSWAPIKPVGLRFEWPLWTIDDTLDPTLLKLDRPRRPSRLKEEIEEASKQPAWTLARFVETFMGEPKTKAVIVADAIDTGLSKAKAMDFLKAAEDRGLVHRWVLGSKVPDKFATRPPDLQDVSSTDSKPKSKRKRGVK